MGAGSVYLFRSNGRLVARLDSENPGAAFGNNIGCCDVDLDGWPDLIVGAPLNGLPGKTEAGSVYFYSGRDLHSLGRIDGEMPGDNLGDEILCCDLDGNGVADLLLGAQGSGTNDGAVIAFSGPTHRQILRLTGITIPRARASPPRTAP